MATRLSFSFMTSLISERCYWVQEAGSGRSRTSIRMNLGRPAENQNPPHASGGSPSRRVRFQRLIGLSPERHESSLNQKSMDLCSFLDNCSPRRVA
jgi:hypothetical protein